MKLEDYVTQMRYFELYCKNYLGENNPYSSDELQCGKYYEAMKAIINEIDRDNKIDFIEAENFLQTYKNLQDKGLSWFIKEKIDLINISEEFERIVGIHRKRGENK